MPKKVTTKASKTKASKTSKSKAASKAASSLSRNASSKTYIGRSSVSGKFVSAKTGRVVKSSPAKPHLGRERIQTAVRTYVRRDDRTGRLAD